LLHYYPRHVSSINMPIFRRKDCVHTASGIFALCKRLHSTQVESRLCYGRLPNSDGCRLHGCMSGTNRPTERLSQTVWATRSDLFATQQMCCRLQHEISWDTRSCVTSIRYHTMLAYRGMEVRFHATFTSPASRHDRSIPCKQLVVEFEQQAGWTSEPERTPDSDWDPQPDCTLARRENL
jgi:hypothetical protein